MKVTLYQWEEDYTFYDELYIDGKCVERYGSSCECPEYACIGRDLISCADIVKWMQKVQEVNDKGETVVFEIIDKNPDEEDE